VKTIRFIRHAESAANAGLPTTDPGGIPLTENGKVAAGLAAAEYDGPEPDLIVISPYLRARQTSEPFLARFPKAEATAFLVARRIGLESHSQHYISSFLRSSEKPAFSMDAVLVAAGKIEAMCHGTFRIR
jgi:broad specificity phosphatase PhoE